MSKSSDKEKAKAPAGKVSGLLGHLHTAVSILSVLLLLVLFSGAMDLGVVDLRSMISGFSIIILPMFAVFALAAVILQMKVAHSRETQLAAKAAEIETYVGETKQSVEAKIQEYLGAENERIKAEHEKMSELLKEIEKQEQDRLVQENEELKVENGQLKEQLSRQNVPLNDELSAVGELQPTGT